MVGGTDGFFIMFHHQHRIAEIAQALEGGQQALIITLMQADGRLIKDVQNAGQGRADLGCQADPLPSPPERCRHCDPGSGSQDRHGRGRRDVRGSP
jgi:hypothetical protein